MAICFKEQSNFKVRLSKEPFIVKYNLQEKTFTENGLYVPDDGYDAFSNVTIDVHDIFYVDELPLTGIDFNKYYKLSDDDALYKPFPLTSSIGTWLLNEKLELTDKVTYNISGTFSNNAIINEGIISVELAQINIGAVVNAITLASVYAGTFNFRHNNYYLSSYYDNNQDEGIDGYSPNFSYIDCHRVTLSNQTDKTSDDGIILRTFEITGGEDVENPELIKWLTNNATYLNGYSWLRYYVPAFQEKTLTENGEYTPAEGYNGFNKIIVDVAADATATEDDLLKKKIAYNRDGKIVGTINQYFGEYSNL